jgi:hypothetical protein
MLTDNCLPVLDEEVECPAVEHSEQERLAPESSTPIAVAYDEECNAITFHERESGRLVHAWVPDRPDGLAIADLFLTLSEKPWGSFEMLRDAAAIVHEICGKAPGQITLQDELVSILRSNQNRWMTTGELATEVNRRGRHWKTYRNRITAAKVLGRTKLYARTFERTGERVRLIAE